MLIWRMYKMKDENICKQCKYFRNIISSDVVFTERVDFCARHGIEWPFEKICKDFENKKEDKK